MSPRTNHKQIDGAEIAKHNTAASCWLVIEGKVYNVTSYLADHPGGAAMLVKEGGKDATSQFSKVHSPDMVQNLPPGSFLGSLDPATASSLASEEHSSSSSSSSSSSTSTHITQCVRVTDFEEPAKAILPHRTWVYISSSANAGLSLARNLASWERLVFRPRILRDVGHVSAATVILGRSSPVPFYIPPMGNHGQMHPGAEPEMTRGAFRCGGTGMHHVVSTSSSVSRNTIAAVLREEEFVSSDSTATLHFQLYVPTDRTKARAIVRQARQAGYASLWITADTAVLGKRTADRRLQADEALGMGLADVGAVNRRGPGDEGRPRKENLGGRPPSGMIDAGLNWGDLQWIREEWGQDRPIVIKGCQTAADVRMALDYGCQGVVLSNHGGRQMGNAPSALETLLEIRRDCPEVLGKIEVLLDGGLRDGADILKALALGATAVGVGRPFLYALAAYGAKGVERCYEILSEELVLGMRLLGVTSLDQLSPGHVNATSLMNDMWRPEKSLL